MIRLPHQRVASAAFDSYPESRSRFNARNPLLWGLAGLLFLLFLSLSSHSGSASLESLRGTQLGALIHSYVEPAGRPQDREAICADCNCTISGSYLLSTLHSKPIPTLAEVRSLRASKATIKRYLVSAISQYLWLHPHFLPEKAIAPLFTQYFTCPDKLISLDFRDLVHGKSTLYMYTRTGDGGRLKANERRLNYFTKHIDTIRSYDELIAREGFPDGLTAKDRQLLWILIEDAKSINDDLDTLIKDSGIRKACLPIVKAVLTRFSKHTSTSLMGQRTSMETHSGTPPNELCTSSATHSLVTDPSST